MVTFIITGDCVVYMAWCVCVSGMFSFYSQPKSHGAATIVEFIEKAMEHSRSGKFLYFLRPRAPGLPPAPVQLLYPVSRFRNMHSLQHLCRFQILKHTRKDLIDRLPIPPRLKEYLKQSQYYTEYCADDIRDHLLFQHRYWVHRRKVLFCLLRHKKDMLYLCL